MKASEKQKVPLVIVTGLALISLITSSPLWLKAALLIGVACIFSGFVERWLVLLWLKLAEGIGWFTSKILLSLIFYIFLMPMALLKRLFTGDSLQLKKKQGPSMFETRNHTYRKKDLENIF